MWNYEGIIALSVLVGVGLSVTFLTLASIDLISWGWEQIRILRRRDGQDV